MKQRNRTFRSILCLVTVLALLVVCLPADTMAEAQQNEDFTPILRFAVTSDVHIRDATSAISGYEQLGKFYSTVYDYAEAQTNYNKLDGIFFIGDLTQRGEVDQLTYFFNYVNTHTKEGTVTKSVLGNHEFYDTDKTYVGDATPKRFMEISGYDSTDHHLEIGGYHFIMMSMDRYSKTNNQYFSEEKLAWLKQELDIAVAADPNRPIFVMQHEPPYQTMKGSYGTASDKRLPEVLADYPQVINFSGHTHVSLSDPRAIWQGTFTALNTGSLCYLSVPIMNGTYNQSGGKANDMEGGWTTGDIEEGTRNAGMYYIVEIDKDHRVRVLTYNMFTQSLWGEPYLIESYDPADFVYTDARQEAAVKPEFAEGSQIRLCSDNYKNVKIAIPQAICKDIVQSYRVEVYQGDTLLQTLYRSSMVNYGEAAPKEIAAYIQGLQQDTTYSVKVYGTSSYNLDSDPLEFSFRTSKEYGKIAPDVLDVAFLEDGTAVDTLSGEVLTTWGAPSVSYDATAGGYVATFDGVDDAYSYVGLGNWYNVINNAYTIESYVYLAQKPASSSKHMNIISNLQSAGMGIQYRSNGKVYTLCHIDGAYKTVNASAAVGSWVHLTTTFDGAKLKLYINGSLAGEADAAGTMTTPELTHLTRSLFIGADCKPEGAENYFNGKVATARVYSQVLSETDVAELYDLSTGAEGSEACPEHAQVQWTEIKNTDWEAGVIAGGHYRLAENVDISGALTIAADAEVCVDLAGYNITASAEAADGKWYRVFENNGKLTILDSAFSDGVISGGKVWASAQEDFAKGGNIYNGAGATFNLYDGIIYGGLVTTADAATPGSIGGNIYGAADSVINIKGGVVSGGIATKGNSYVYENYVFGGNIGSDGTVNISGGSVIGGQVTLNYTVSRSGGILYLYGGNIAVRPGASLNISGGIIADGSSNGSRINTGGTATVYGRGGNIFANETSLTVTGGVISGGEIRLTASGIATGSSTPGYAHAYGGNIYILGGTANISGGTISGGILSNTATTLEGSTSSAVAKATERGGNIYLTGGAVANITGGTITGGRVEHNEATEDKDNYYGGNIFVYSTAVLNMSGGTVSNGYCYYRGGNIGAESGGTINLSGTAMVKGGTLSNYSSACNGDNIVVLDTATTLNIYGQAQVIENSSKYSIYSITNAKVNMYGGTVVGGINMAATSSNKSGKFTMRGGSVDKLTKSSYIPATNMVLSNGVLGQAPTEAWLAECACYVDNGNGTYTIWHENATDGTCTDCAYDYAENNITMQSGKHNFVVTEAGMAACHCGDTKTGVVTILDGTAYTSLTEAFAASAAGDTVVMVGNSQETTVTTNISLTLDLNGFAVSGDVTAAQGATLFIKDTQTDDYTVEDDNYGRIAGTVTGVQAAEGYLQITEADGTSYHKVDVKITSVSLRADSAGLYYKAQYQYDQVVARNLDASGVALSTKNRNPVADGSDPESLYTASGTSVLLSGILKTQNTVNANKTNAAHPVYGRAYMKLLTGEIVYSGSISTSLKDVLLTVDAKYWDGLSDAQKAALKQMYDTYADVMANWELTNLKAYQG